MLTRRWPAAVLAAVFVAALWSLVLAGPVLANHAGPAEVPAAVQTQAQAIAADTPVRQETSVEGNPKYKTTRAATPKEAPEGSPFYVQVIMIVILLVLGVAYFRLMRHSGRRTPAAKAQPATIDAADEKQPSDA